MSKYSPKIIKRVFEVFENYYDFDTLREKRLYWELFWSVFSSIRTEYGEIQSISPHSVQMRENTDQNNSEYGQILRSDKIFRSWYVFLIATDIIWNE